MGTNIDLPANTVPSYAQINAYSDSLRWIKLDIMHSDNLASLVSQTNSIIVG